MALKKTNQAAFEQEPTVESAAAETATVNTPAETSATVTEAPVQAETKPAVDPAVAASTAIAKASSTAVAVENAAAQAKQFQKEVEAMKGASDFSYGNFRVFKGSNGAIEESGGDEATFGRWVKVRLLSWDDHFEVSPGEQGASTKDFVAYSKDGKTLDSVIGEELKSWEGRSVNEYLEYLKKEEEFANAKVRRFVDTAVAVMAADDADGPIGEVVQITLSESSIPAFSKYQEDLKNKARCVAMGLPGFSMPEDPFTFYFIRESASKGDKKWTKLKIASNLPSKI